MCFIIKASLQVKNCEAYLPPLSKSPPHNKSLSSTDPSAYFSDSFAVSSVSLLSYQNLCPSDGVWVGLNI